MKTIFRFFYFHTLAYFDKVVATIIDMQSNKKNSKVVIIRTDAIGDYVLFRNFLKPLYEKYGKLTFVGNVACKELVTQLDGEYIKHFIAIDRKKISRNLIYRFKIIKELKKTSYEILINSIYSRDRVSEDIVRIIDAREKIASIGDCSNLPKGIKQQYDKNYTTLLPAKQEIMFEFYRNLEFFQNLLGKDLHVDFFIDLKKIDRERDFGIIPPYSVFFIGASAQYRKWGNNHFVEVGKFLHSNFYENIVICGGKEDFENGEYIRQKLEQNSIYCLNLCGKTSLLDLARVVYNGNHLISNETSCVHIAKAIRHDKVFVVSNGNHLHRFTPYPKELGGEYYGIFHPFIQANLDEYVFISNYSGKTSTLDINDISSQSVIVKIKECEYNSSNNQH